MNTENLEIKDNNEVENINYIKEAKDNLGVEIMSDCFIALTLSILRQFLLSSNSKYFIFSDMFDFLTMKGYSEEQILVIKENMKLIIDKYNLYNDFMG